MLSYLIFGITYSFAASLQPGPFQTFIISQALNKGWRPAIPAAFAHLVSDAPIIIMVLLFLSNVSESLIHLLQIGGGLFLLFMAFNTFKTWLSYDVNESAKNQSVKQTLFKSNSR
jgi:threonine/homoserine/homoserine lactone efflux protein